MLSIQKCRQAVAARRHRPAPNLPPPPAVEVPRRSRTPDEASADLRWDKVQAIRAAIFTGRYDVDARLEHLVEHVPDDIAHLLNS